VQFGKALRQRQPEAGALRLARGIPADLLELLENRGLISGAMPAPESETDTSTIAPSGRARTPIVPPSGVNFTAFESRLT